MVKKWESEERQGGSHTRPIVSEMFNKVGSEFDSVI
jgi:hypothetical protein